MFDEEYRYGQQALEKLKKQKGQSGFSIDSEMKRSISTGLKESQAAKEAAASKIADEAAKTKAFEAGEDLDKVKETTAGSGNLDKAAAAAKIAQSMGIGPQGGMMGGAMSGAATGAAFGGPGAVIGAVAGGIMGAAQSRAAAKAHNAKLEAEKQKALGEIEMEKGRQLSQAIGSMGARMSASLR